MELHNIDIKYDSLDNIKFVNIPNKKQKLNSPVVIYNDGIKYKIIPLFVFKKYPIIHDIYYRIKNKQGEVISIYVCPNTLFSAMYFGNYMPIKKTYHDNLIISNNDISFIPIINECISMDCIVQRNEIYIMTFKNALFLYPDAIFMQITHFDFDISFELIDTLIYVIEYKSKKQNKYKYTILVPHINSFDIIKNKYKKYIGKMGEMLKNKGAIIYPCYLNYWYNSHNEKSHKTIKL